MDVIYDDLDISCWKISTLLIQCPQTDLEQLVMPWKLGLQVVFMCVACVINQLLRHAFLQLRYMVGSPNQLTELGCKGTSPGFISRKHHTFVC